MCKALQAARGGGRRGREQRIVTTPLGPPLHPKRGEDVQGLKKLLAARLAGDENGRGREGWEGTNGGGPLSGEGASFDCEVRSDEGQGSDSPSFSRGKSRQKGGRWRGEAMSSEERLRALLPHPRGLPEEDLIRHVELVPYLQHLPEEELRALLLKSQRKVLPRYAVVMREGSYGSSFYMLLQATATLPALALMRLDYWSGPCDDPHASRPFVAFSADLSVSLCSPAHFGETSLIQAPRHADVTTLAVCELLVLNASDLIACSIDTLEGYELGVQVRVRLAQNMLTTIKFFRGLYPQQLAKMARLVQLTYFKTNEVVFSVGDPGDSFYLLIRGSIGIFVNVYAKAPVASGLAEQRQDCVATYSHGQEVHSDHFSDFFALCPEFEGMIQMSSHALTAISKMMSQAQVGAQLQASH
ncbi:MAG: hypothetical protein SGPRY_008467 [Prymnesium sp.]